MRERRYWGESNQYGPYTEQADGWPNAGEVIRDYRKRVRRMSAETLGRLYGEFQGEAPVSERWIQALEKNNKVPQELHRRKAFSSLLGIPPILLGLGVLEDLHHKETIQPTIVSNIIKTVDIATHTEMLDIFWMLDHTSTAQGSLSSIESTILRIRAETLLVTGEQQKQLLGVLCGYYALASTIYADQCNYEKAWSYANDGVTLASNLQNNKLQAVALYQRGFVCLEMASYKDTLNPAKVQAAIDDFNAAIPLSPLKVEAHIQLDLALANALLKRSNSADVHLFRAGNILDKGGLDEGTFVDLFADLNTGRYKLGQAVVYTTLKRYEDASDLLFEAREGINPAQTRRLAWSDAIESKIYFGQNNYQLAAQRALAALKVCKAINSQANIHIVKGVYTQLLTTKYAAAIPVRELGAALYLPQ